MAKQQHGEGGMSAIADIVAKAFTELKEDMDRIVNSGEVQSPAGTLPAGAAGASEEQLPAVQLGHGRTCSESPGYDDVELPDLEYSMPEALQSMDVPSPGSLAAAPAASSAAEGCGISVHRTYATNVAGSRDPSFTLQQQQSSTRGSPTALAANGPCNILATDSPPLVDMTACVDMAATPSAAALPAAAPAAASPVQAATKQLAMFSAGNSINPSSSGTASLAAGGNWLQDTAVAADDAAGSRPPASSHLTYTELLDRAVAGMDPRLQQMSSNLLTRTSSRASVERRRTSGEGASRRSSGSSAGGMSAARPSSCGRAAAAARPAGAGMLSLDGGFGRQQPPGLLSARPWQAKSKFPAGSAVAAAGGAARRSSARSAAENSTEASMRIFKQGSGSAMKLLVEVDELGACGAGAAEQRRATVRSSFDSQAGSAGQRSRSAPREVAAVTHHVKRLHHSPASPARAEGCGTAILSSPPEQQQGGSGRPKSDPRHTKGYIDRLYMQGVEKQIKRAHQPEHRNVSPVRLSEEDWNRVTRRLHLDARAKDERMRERREHQSDKMDAAARPTHAQALQDSTAQRSSGGGGRTAGGSGGGNCPSAAFYERQQALTERRKQRQEQRRPSDEGELEECVFHPQINPVSKGLRRSVEDMHKWEDHKRLHVYVLSEEKAEHEYDGYTWAPQINSSSRRIALASYAAAPDPARPWTTSPRHKTAPPRQASPPRQPSPPPRSIASAGASYGYFPAEVHYAHPSPQEQQKQEQQLRHGIAGAPMAGAAGGQEVPASTSCLVLAEPGISQPLRAAAGQAAGSDGAQARPAAAAAWQQRAAQLVEQLPPGTVVGIPVAEAAAVQFRSGQPAAAMATPHQAVTGSSRASKAMVPVAAGDGVAFISLGPIRTAAAAAQPGASVDAGSAGGSADWGHHLGRAGGSGSYDDSAGNTPTKHQFGAAGRSAAAAAAARAFRDDSAGGMHVPARKVSTGGSWFAPVVSAGMKGGSPLSKLKQQEGGVLHPTLSDATRAALELSHLAIGVANPADSIGLGASAAQQAVPAYYVAMDASPNLGDSYSARYAYTKAAAAAAAKGGVPGVPAQAAEHWLKGAYASGASLSVGDWPARQYGSSTDDSKKAAMEEWQLQQQAAAAVQHKQYSAAQLINARQRSSVSGAKALSRECSLEAGGGPGPASAALPAADAAADHCYPHHHHHQQQHRQAAEIDAFKQMLGGVGVENSAMLVSEHTVIDNGQLQEQLAEMTASMLNQTQSVPFELMGSPRSRLYLTSNAEGRPATAQQLLVMLGREEAAAGLHQHQQQQQASSSRGAGGSDTSSPSAGGASCDGSYGSPCTASSALRPAAGSPYLPDSSVNSPAAGNSPHGSSHNLLTVGQRAVLLASKLSASSRVADARQAGEAAWPAGPEGVSLAAPAEASVILQPVAAEPLEVRSSWTGAAQQSEAASTGGLAEAASHPAPPGSCSVGGQSGVQAAGAKVAAEPAAGEAGAADGGEVEAVSTAELLGMLFGPTKSPEDKARKMAATFKKTISRHNLPINDLEKTLAALLPAAAATATAVPAQAGTTDYSRTCQTEAAAEPAAAVATEATAAATAAAADPLDSDSMQELLAHVSALEALSVPASPPSGTSACSSPSGSTTSGSTCRTPAPRAAAGAGAAAAAAAAETEVGEAKQRTATWEDLMAEAAVGVGASVGAGTLNGCAPCSPAAAAAAGSARRVSHGSEVRSSSASKGGSTAGGPGWSDGGGAELPELLSLEATAAAPHSPHSSSAGCASPGKAV